MVTQSKWKRRLLPLLASGLIMSLGGAAHAQSNYLLNTTKGTVPALGKWEARFTGTFFGSDEKNGYFGLNGIYGLGNGWGVLFNGGFAGRRTTDFPLASIRTGGTDLELQAIYAVPEVKGLSVAAGFSLPSTPNQDQAFFTARGVYGYHFDGFDGYLGASGVFREDSSLSAITVGLETKETSGFSFVGEFNGVISGENTYNSIGQARRVSTYGIGVRYRVQSEADLTSFLVAWTNSLGSTTGFSLSPGLNNSGALFVGVSLSK